MRAEQIAVGPVVVAGNTAVNIEVFSEKGPFRAHNMIMSEEDARPFFITDLKVGKNSQFVTSSAVHADFFARRGMTDNLLFDALPRGMKMTVCAQNMTDEPKTFSSVLRGELYDDNKTSARDRACAFDGIILGLGHFLVPANGKGKISVQPQVGCKVNRIVIPAYVLDGLVVKSVRAVGEEVLLGELQNGEAELKESTMQISDWLCVEVENKTDKLRAFYGAVGARLIR